MSNKFTYPKFYKSLEKKNLNANYSVYDDSRDTIKSLVQGMGACNEKYDFEEQYIMQYPMPLEKSVAIARTIVKQEFGNSLLYKFDELNYTDKVKFYNGFSEYLCDYYDHGNGFCCSPNTKLEKQFLYAPVIDEIDDVISIMHEVCHFAICNESTKTGELAYELLAELIPLYSEFLVLNYFQKQIPNSTSYYETVFERYNAVSDYYEALKDVDYRLDEIPYTIRNFEELQYDLALLCASKLYYEYQQDPDTVRLKIDYFCNSLRYEDFNILMKILDMPVRIQKTRIYFQTGGLEELLYYYQRVLEEIYDDYQNALEFEKSLVKNIKK